MNFVIYDTGNMILIFTDCYNLTCQIGKKEN